MSIQYSGQFVGFDGATRRVEFSRDDYSGDATTLVLTGVQIEGDDDDDPFTAIRSTRGTVSFYSTETGMLKNFVVGSATEMACVITNDETGAEEFSGYVKPETLTQAYTGEGAALSVTIQDRLAIMDGMRLDCNGGACSIGGLLRECLLKVGFEDTDAVALPNNTYPQGGDSVADLLAAECRRDAFRETDATTYRHVGIYVDEAVDILLQPFGWWITSVTGGVRICSHNVDEAADEATMTVADLADAAEGSTPTWEDAEVEAYGTSNEVSYYQGSSAVVVTLNQPLLDDNLLDDADPSNFEVKVDALALQAYSDHNTSPTYGYLTLRNDVNKQGTVVMHTYAPGDEQEDGTYAADGGNDYVTEDNGTASIKTVETGGFTSHFDEWAEAWGLYTDDTGISYTEKPALVGAVPGCYFTTNAEDEDTDDRTAYAYSVTGSSSFNALVEEASEEHGSWVFMPSDYLYYRDTAPLTYLTDSAIMTYVSDVDKVFYAGTLYRFEIEYSSIRYHRADIEESDEQAQPLDIMLGVVDSDGLLSTWTRFYATSELTQLFFFFEEKREGRLYVRIGGGCDTDDPARVIIFNNIELTEWGQTLDANTMENTSVAFIDEFLRSRHRDEYEDEDEYRADSENGYTDDEYEVEISLGSSETMPNAAQLFDADGTQITEWTSNGETDTLPALLLGILRAKMDAVREIMTIQTRQTHAFEAGDVVTFDGGKWRVMAVGRDYYTGTQTLTMMEA